jgi:hypothetical protein
MPPKYDPTGSMGHYDPGLNDALGNGKNRSGICLNPVFREWSAHIKNNLAHRNVTRDDSYTSGIDRELFAACSEHAKRHQKGSSHTSTVMLTHPFYMHLSHMHYIRTESTRKQADRYLGNLLTVFNKRPALKANIVVLETLHHYAAATSLLIEKGQVDRAASG